MPTYNVSLKLRDAYKRRATLRRQVDAVDFTIAGTKAGALASAMANLMEAEILAYSVGQDTDYSDTVDTGANLDEGITITCDLGAGKTAPLKIPSPVNGVLNADGTVDMTDVLITSLESQYIAGDVLISDGEVALGFLSGKLDR